MKDANEAPRRPVRDGFVLTFLTLSAAMVIVVAVLSPEWLGVVLAVCASLLEFWKGRRS